MKKLIAVVMLLVITSPAFADVFDGQAAYIGGTIVGVKEGTVGKLDTTNEKLLVFEHPGGKVAIPYDRIERWDYQQVVAHHLGVLPTIAIVMIKYRQRRHLFHIQFKDDAGTSQAAVIEVPKEMPKAFSAVLEARVKGCKISYDQQKCDVPPPPRPSDSNPKHGATTQSAQNAAPAAQK